MSLSLAMIVRDEAGHLGRCLRSVAGLVDEIVVVDTGSVDDTVAVARAAGARVEHFQWTGDFAEARNEALRHCGGDWVLQLDADEEIEAGWHDGLRELLSRPLDCWLLRIVNLLDGKQSLAHHGTRLFRRLPGIRYDGRVHESIDHFVQSAGLSVSSTNVTILHHGYGSAADRRRKAERNMGLHMAQLAAGERPVNIWYNLFNSAAQLDDPQGAGHWLQLALADNQRVRRPQRAELLIRLYQNVIDAQPFFAKHVLDVALELAPEQMLGWILLAKRQAKIGDFGEAVSSLNRAIRVASGESCSQMSGDVVLDVATLERWKVDIIEAASRTWHASDGAQGDGGVDG